MRTFLLLSLCVLSLNATSLPESPKKDVMVRYDDRNDYAGGHFDYAAMLQFSAQKFEQFASRIEKLAAQEGEELLVPANDDEQTDVVLAYGYFLIALFRMRQEAECIIDENAAMAPTAIWYSMSGIFAIFPKDLLLESVGEVLEYIQDHGNDTWAATEQLEHYKPASEWPTLRQDANEKFTQFLQELAKTLQ